MQYEAEFTALARYAPQLVSTSAERCYRFLRGLRDTLRQPLIPFRITDFSELVERARLIENDMTATQQRWTASRKRFGGETSGSGSSGKRRFVPGSGSGDSRKSGGSSGTATSTTSSGSVSTAPVCQSCGRRHHGQCYRIAGLCFRCGQPGHRIAECPQMGFDQRSEQRSEGFVRPVGSAAGRPRTVPPRPEGFAGRGELNLVSLGSHFRDAQFDSKFAEIGVRMISELIFEVSNLILHRDSRRIKVFFWTTYQCLL
ncbi:hypothetical protein MA16_Dca023096 [Dendrobium catenatum]|uniref:CCHC-type domain-containing protein n=1 Tax=Dendrobium catenatum TaxID=906689 RepID=A0A2I0X0G2_9ASPA|nr:hypothetical protein MA16_Dca023096 [Dendrobium catenatum]